MWPIISRQAGAKNPHDAYWFYFHANDLQAVTSGDGRWKLQFPHTYATLAGRPGGTNGLSVPYSERKVEKEELYDLVHDISETTDVSAQHPDIVKQLESYGDMARTDLGDDLTKREGANRREPGRLPEVK